MMDCQVEQGPGRGRCNCKHQMLAMKHPWNDQLGMVEELAHRTAWRYKYSSDPNHSHTYTFNRHCLLEFAAKLIAAERERCARLCESMGPVLCERYGDGAECIATADACAAALLGPSSAARLNQLPKDTP